MLQWIIIVFTAVPPAISPAVQYIPVPSLERCRDTIRHVTPDYEAAAEEYGLIYRLECRKIKFVDKEAETEGKEGDTVNE